MHLTIKDPVTTLEEWRNTYPPAKAHHWTVGRSALELARLILDSAPNLPKAVEKAISDLTHCSTFIGEGEYATEFPLDYGRRGPRQHDFIMQSDDLLVTIEAKTDENFAFLVSSKCHPGMSENQRKRYHGLMHLLFGQEANEENDVRYQLVSASAGTLIEAKKRKLKKALLLVVVFKTDLTNHDKIAMNEQDYLKFIHQLNADPLTGRVHIFEPTYSDIEFYIRKIQIG